MIPFATTVIGSFPHQESLALTAQLVACLDIPAWPQLPRRSFKESMYGQFSAVLPGIVRDDKQEKIRFDTTGDLSDALEQFYTHYLADDLEAFALTPAYAHGFFDMIRQLGQTPGEWAKGQVTGPISFGLTVTDQNLRSSLYDEMLTDVIVKNMAGNARWQVRQLQAVRPRTLIFVDEPYLAAFGSAFISLSREQAIVLLDELFAAIHQEGALAGVHCCANTDWSLLLATTVDILNLDAYGFLENLALYPAELRAFLDRGGRVAWGIVPNNEEIFTVTAETLAERLHRGFQAIQTRAQARGVGITGDELATRSLITPSCGLGSASRLVADTTLEILVRTGEILRRG